MKLRSTYICALLVFLAMIPAPALAAPPASPYMPGETLDPSCAPGSSNCTVTSTQSVANGGTGWTNIVSGTILYGNGSSALATTSAGTAGNVLALLGGVPTWTATTTFSTGLAYMSGNVTLNTANANTWTALQQFSNASTTLFSAYGPAYFGSSATSSFSSTGTLTLASALTVGNGGTGATSFGQGWLFSSGDGAALSASTSPTVNYITATSTTATSTFANGVNITGGCFARNGVCIATGSGSDLQHAALYDTNEAMTNIPTGGAQTTLGTVSVTPTSVTGDVYVTGWVDAYSGDVTDQPLELVIETTNNCTGSTVGNASVTYTITTGASTANVRGTIRVSGIAVDPGASAQPYSLCAAITSGGGDSDIMNWGIEALVIDTGADVAEIYTTRDAALEAGDVVSIDPALNAGVHKSQSAHDQNAIGIISTRPGMLIGGAEKEGVKAVPVALSGRVPVKVVTENGAIKPGDYLTPSSVPGVAMKTQGRGHVIGQAIGAFDGEGVGIVVAFIKNFDLDEGALRMGDISSSSTDLNVIQSESAHDPIAILAKKITDGAQFLTDFIAARVTAIRGYFDEVFANKVHTQELCMKKSGGSEVCINGDQVDQLLSAPGGHDASAIPEVSSSMTDEIPSGTSVIVIPPSSIGQDTETPPSAEASSDTSLEVVTSEEVEPVGAETPTDIPPPTPDLPTEEAEVVVPVDAPSLPSETAPEPTL